MLPFELRGVRRVALFGAHPDDLEIGAGGLLLRLAEAVPSLDVRYVLLSGTAERKAEARAAAAAFLSGARIDFQMHDLPDGRTPAHWGRAKEIVQAASVGGADLVVTMAKDDAHQDHRLVAELASTAFRDAVVLHYEIPKWDGDLGRRNVYVPLTDEQARRKVELLHAHFPSQKDRDWWDDEVFLGLARLRGMECRSRYAEAYTCEKAVISL